MNKVFIATSLDGYIADENGSVDYLYKYPEPAGEDMGYYQFISTIDAIIMGRKTFETVLGFGVKWPYEKPVFVWSSTLNIIPEELNKMVKMIQGTPQQIVLQMQQAGYINLYIDGGQTIQSFLKEKLIDEITITTVPVLLGCGISLFGKLESSLYYQCIDSKRYPHGVTQSTYALKND